MTTTKTPTPSPKDAKADNPSEASSERTARKEKMLHARIPEDLDREIKRRAGSLGMSVSTVVRHVLLNTFNLVEDIVADSTNLALSITGEKPGPSASKTPRSDTAQQPQNQQDQIIGWQEAILDRNAVCEHCNAILATGTNAAIAITEQTGPRSIICTNCLAKRLKSAAGARISAA